MCVSAWCFFFFKQKTAYEMRIRDWSSDVCSSDLSATSKSCEVRALASDGAVYQHTSNDTTISTAVSTIDCHRKMVSLKGSTPVKIGRASCRERVCQYV